MNDKQYQRIRKAMMDWPQETGVEIEDCAVGFLLQQCSFPWHSVSRLYSIRGKLKAYYGMNDWIFDKLLDLEDRYSDAKRRSVEQKRSLQSWIVQARISPRVAKLSIKNS